jgi:hypothetical protein
LNSMCRYELKLICWNLHLNLFDGYVHGGISRRQFLDGVWRFASVYLAEHAPKPRVAVPGIDDEAEPPAQSRLVTALPLVRSMILGVVVGVTALIVLSTLGVDIGPLLAGFGVVGLAISFGSQALVRDIMSGIFFMADDAFRVGEYVDTGRLKGTVEKITMRSVQLRHQSGLVHTVPFGQLQAITNASRDWATVKFNIRLERGIDLDQARKIHQAGRPRDARGSRARARDHSAIEAAGCGRHYRWRDRVPAQDHSQAGARQLGPARSPQAGLRSTRRERHCLRLGCGHRQVARLRPSRALRGRWRGRDFAAARCPSDGDPGLKIARRQRAKVSNSLIRVAPRSAALRALSPA